MPLEGRLLELALLVAPAVGPVLVTVAIAVYSLSLRRAPRNAQLFARLARQPLFWLVAPWLVLGVMFAHLNTRAMPALSLPSGPAVTLAKNSATHFAQSGSAISATLDTAANRIEFRPFVTAGTNFLNAPNFSPTSIGEGGHALQGANGEFLVVFGGGSQSAAVFQEGTGAFTSLALTFFNVKIGKGALSFKRDDGTFLLVAGGDGDTGFSPKRTFVVTQNCAATPCTWSVADGPDLSGTNGAGNGAHAFKYASSPGKWLIAHGGSQFNSNKGNTETSIYDGSTTAAGPAISDFLGAGAHSIKRTDGKFLIVHGNVTTKTSVFDPAASPQPATLPAGLTLTGQVDVGGHAIRFGAGSNFRLVVHGGGAPGSTLTTKLDLTANTAVAGPATSAGVGAGAHAIQRGDGKWVIVHGRSTLSTSTFDPASAASPMAVSPSTSDVVGAGAFTLHRTDGTFRLFIGGGQPTVNTYDGGWTTLGSWTSEAINPGELDQWKSIGWTRAADPTITLEVRFASTSAGLASASYTSFATATTSGTTTFVTAVQNKWAQVRVTLSRPTPTLTEAHEKIWRGSSGTFDFRSVAASPQLTELRLDFTAGVFVLTATTPQTAGIAFQPNIDLRDQLGNRIVDYVGTHILTFSGATVAPDLTSAPSVVDTSASAIPFGNSTSVAFATVAPNQGLTTPSLTLYKVENPNITVTETVVSPGPFAAFTLTTHTRTTATAAGILVVEGVPSTSVSQLVASPTTAIADGVAAITLTATVFDGFKNPVRSREVTFCASTDGGVSCVPSGGPTISPATPPPTDVNGQTSTTARSASPGTFKIIARIARLPTEGAGSPFEIAQKPEIVFVFPVAADITIRKTTQAQFTQTGTSRDASLDALGTGGLSFSKTIAAAAETTANAAATPFAFGAGAHAVQGPGDDFLVFHGGANTSVYDGLANAFVTGRLTGSTGTISVGTGSFSIPLPDGHFLLFNGGTNTTVHVTPPASVGGNWTKAAGPTFGTNFGAGANAIQYTVDSATKYLVIHGGNTALTTIYDHSGDTTTTGPTLQANASDGAMSLKKDNGDYVILHGGGAMATSSVFIVTTQTIDASSGPSATGNVGAGGHAIKYVSGGNKYLVVHGGTSSTTSVFDAAAGTMAAGRATAANVAAGAHSVQRLDAFQIWHGGGATTSSVFDPASSTSPLPAGATVSGGIGDGGFSLQRTEATPATCLALGSGATDKAGCYLVVQGSAATTSTAHYDAGWRTSGRWTSEKVKPGNVDKFTTIGWTRTDSTIALDFRSAATETAIDSAAYATFPTTSGLTGESSVTAAVADKVAQLRATFTRPVPAMTGVSAKVWLGASAVVQTRTFADPTLSELRLRYLTGVLSVSATTPQTAGTGFSFTLTFKDSASSTVTDYTGAHTLRFVGAQPAPRAGFFPVIGQNCDQRTSYVLKQGNSDLAGGADFSRVLSTGTETPGTISVSVAAGAAEDSFGFTPANDPGAGGGSGSRPFTVEMDVRTANSNVSVQAFVARVNASGSVQMGPVSLGAAQSAGTVGVKTFTGSTDLGTFASGDGLRVTYRFVNSDGVSAQSVIIGTGTGYAEVLAPWDTSVKFGDDTVVTFANGTATVTVTLCRAETANLQVSETIALGATLPAGWAVVAQQTINSLNVATVLVQPGFPSTARSTITPSATTVLADNVATVSLSIIVRDNFDNPLSGRTVTLSSTRGIDPPTAGAPDKLVVSPGLTNANGLTAAILRSPVAGTTTFTASVAAVSGEPGPTTIDRTTSGTPAAVTFIGSRFLVEPLPGLTHTAGVAFAVRLTALDSSGNVDTSFSGDHTISFSTTATARTSPGAGPAAVLPGPTALAFSNGVATTGSVFTLYNSGELPTIAAAETNGPFGTSAGITVQPAAAFNPNCDVSASPSVVNNDNISFSVITVLVQDQFFNPIAGRVATLASSRTPDTVDQPSQPTNTAGQTSGQVRSNSVGTSTLSATVRNAANTANEFTCTDTATVEFQQKFEATGLTVQTQNNQLETTGVAFSITIKATKADGTIDTNFCSGKCTITVTHTGQVALDGTSPTSTNVTFTDITFTNGVFTTGQIFTLYRANQSPAVSFTATDTGVNDPGFGLTATTSPILVSPNVPNLAKSEIFTTISAWPTKRFLSAPPIVALTTNATSGTLAGAASYAYRVTALNDRGETTASTETNVFVPGGTSTNTVSIFWRAVPGATGYNVYGRTAGGTLLLATLGSLTGFTDTGAGTPSGAAPTANTAEIGDPIPVRAKVVDNWRNWIPGRTITLSSTLCGSFLLQPGASTDQFGVATANMTCDTSGPATIGANVGGTGGGAITNSATLEFYQPRINNGTAIGKVLTADGTTTVTSVPLSVVVRDLNFDTVPGTVSITWTVSGVGLGQFSTNPTNTIRTDTAPPNPVRTVTFSTTTFTATRAGAVNLTATYTIPSGSPGAGNLVAVQIPLTIASFYDVLACADSGEQTLARVEWDGERPRILSWVTIADRDFTVPPNRCPRPGD